MTSDATTITRGPGATAPLAELTGTDPERDLLQIGRLAVHLAAFNRAVLPVAAAQLRDGARRADDVRQRGRDLAAALHWLDRHLTGDARVAGARTGELCAAAQAAARAHGAAERALIGDLAQALDGDEIVTLIRSYHQASLTAPTRPHPWLHRGGLAGRLAAMFTGRLDAVRDVLDNRAARPALQVTAAEALPDLGQLAVTAPAGPVQSPRVPALARP